ncbi:HDOD domain-containing protein [Massilia sp. W12]|uniref:HDOD domain-containing protein n=1 Tax=Massilia sp. W12 TaxID=3126507 RepID=UPI0030D1F627
MDEQKDLRAETTQKLLTLLDQDEGFAALASSVNAIVNMDEDTLSGNREIVVAALRDAGLTCKLLRAANATARGKSNVLSIDQAISVLGLSTVKQTAAALPLLASIQNKSQLQHLHAEIIAAWFCGALSAIITRHNGGRYNPQEAQVCGLLQNLGRICAYYYLFDEIEKSHTLQAERNLTEDEAISHTLGMSFEELGNMAAQHWSFPDVLQQSLAVRAEKVPPRPPASAQAWHPVAALFARDVTDALFRLPEGRERIVIQHDLNFFHQALGLKNDETQEWIQGALADLDSMLKDMQYPCDVEHARMMLRKSSEKVLDSLSSQDSLTRPNPRSGGKKPIDMIHQALRILHDEYDFDLVLLCLPDGSGGLTAVSGVGRNANQIAQKFHCHGQRPDLFRILMSKNADVYVGDIRNPTYSRLLPEWFHPLVGGKSFQVWSLSVNGRFFGMLYADYSEARTELPKEKNEGTPKKWRDVILAALVSCARPS